MAQDEKYAEVSIAVNADCNWTVSPEDIELFKSGDNQTKFKRIEWTISGVADDTIVIVIAREGCFQKNNQNEKRNVYSTVLDNKGIGTVRTRNLRADVGVDTYWKYAIIRVSDDAKKVCCKDPQISVRG